VFDKLIQVLVFGCGYRRIADATCSATTLRRCRDEWIAQGLAAQLHLAVLDAGYDYLPCRQVLAERGMVGQIATRGVPASIQVGRRWVVERTHAWGNQ
jgi:hypothetical protein